MGKVVLTHTLRSHFRSPTLRWLAALGISLSALGALLPVRFREHDEVLLETFQATHLLLGLLFSALLALPALRPEHRLYAPARWGLPAARPHAIVLWDAVGTALVLLALVVVTTVAQGVILVVDGSGIGLRALIGLVITSYAYSCSLVGWGRLLGRYLPAVPGMVVLFAVAVAPRWIAEALRGGSAAAPSAPTWRRFQRHRAPDGGGPGRPRRWARQKAT